MSGKRGIMMYSPRSYQLRRWNSISTAPLCSPSPPSICLRLSRVAAAVYSYLFPTHTSRKEDREEAVEWETGRLEGEREASPPRKMVERREIAVQTSEWEKKTERRKKKDGIVGMRRKIELKMVKTPVKKRAKLVYSLNSPPQHSQIIKEKEPESPLPSDNAIKQAYDQSSPNKPLQSQDIVQATQQDICEFEAKSPLIAPTVASIAHLQPEAPSNPASLAEEMQLVLDQPDSIASVSHQPHIYPLQPAVPAVFPLFPPAFPANPFLSPVPVPSSTYSFVFGAQPSFGLCSATSQPIPSVPSPRVFGSTTGLFGPPLTGGFNIGVVKKRTSR